MEEHILIRTLGDTHFLKVLGFFLEHPMQAHSAISIAEYLGIARDTVRKDLELYEGFDYLTRVSERGPYKLKLNNSMVQTLIKCVDALTLTEMDGERGVPFEALIPTIQPQPQTPTHVASA